MKNILKENNLKNETLNIENRIVTDPSIPTSILTQEARESVILIKKIMREEMSTLLLLRNQDWKKIKVETEI